MYVLVCDDFVHRIFDSTQLSTPSLDYRVPKNQFTALILSSNVVYRRPSGDFCNQKVLTPSPSIIRMLSVCLYVSLFLVVYFFLFFGGLAHIGKRTIYIPRHFTLRNFTL